jgi:hypothetical protein
VVTAFERTSIRQTKSNSFQLEPAHPAFAGDRDFAARPGPLGDRAAGNLDLVGVRVVLADARLERPVAEVDPDGARPFRAG